VKAESLKKKKIPDCQNQK